MTTQDVANAKRDTRSKKRFAFPYGEIWVDEHKSQTDLPFKFTGKELDPETGLYYYGARYYDARLSRWISADPALEKYMPKATDFDTEHDFYWYVQNDASGKLPGMGGVFNSLNLDMYAYAGMNPVKLVDPDGNCAVAWPIIVELTAIGGSAALLAQAMVKLIGDLEKLEGKTGFASKFERNVKSAMVGLLLISASQFIHKAEGKKDDSKVEGSTHSGQQTDEHGNKVGASGKPQVHKKRHASRKRAKDAARDEGSGKPVHHPSPKKGEPHFHPSEGGKKIPGSTHHEY